MADQTLNHRVTAPETLAPAAHPDVAWRSPTPDDIDDIHAALVAADEVDHPTWAFARGDVEDWFDLPQTTRDDLLVGETPDGRIVAVGAAIKQEDTSLEVRVSLQGAVVPEMRRRGLGSAVGRWQYDRALQLLAAETDATVDGVIEQYVHEDDPGAAVIAGGLGMTVGRWFVVMERALTEPVFDVEGDVEPGVDLVPLAADRVDDVRLARNDAFRDHWGSVPYSEEYWNAFTGSEHFSLDLSTVALIDGEVAAFCLVTVNEDNWERRGLPYAYIEYIGVVRAHRGKGLAPRVIRRTLRAMAAAELKATQLDVDTDSPTGANTLYESLGFVERDREQVFTRHF